MFYLKDIFDEAYIGYVQLKLLTQQNYFVIDIYGDFTMLQTPFEFFF